MALITSVPTPSMEAVEPAPTLVLAPQVNWVMVSVFGPSGLKVLFSRSPVAPFATVSAVSSFVLLVSSPSVRSFTGNTFTVTVAVLVPLTPSVIVYWNVSVPLKSSRPSCAGGAVYTKVPLPCISTVPPCVVVITKPPVGTIAPFD